MAEPISCRLRTRRPVGAMLRALAVADWDTTTLVCLAGRWLDGTVLIGWQPSRVMHSCPDDPAPADPSPAGPARFGAGWIGWLDYAGGGWFGYFDTVLCGDRTGWWLESTGGTASTETASTEAASTEAPPTSNRCYRCYRSFARSRGCSPRTWSRSPRRAD